LPVCFADAGLDKCEATLPKQPWTSSEKKIVHEYFAKHIQNNKLPGKKECVSFIQLNKGINQDRKWSNIKDYVRNYLVNLKKAKMSGRR
jgi:hypothetical protein